MRRALLLWGLCAQLPSGYGAPAGGIAVTEQAAADEWDSRMLSESGSGSGVVDPCAEGSGSDNSRRLSEGSGSGSGDGSGSGGDAGSGDAPGDDGPCQPPSTPPPSPPPLPAAPGFQYKWGVEIFAIFKGTCATIDGDELNSAIKTWLSADDVVSKCTDVVDERRKLQQHRSLYDGPKAQILATATFGSETDANSAKSSVDSTSVADFNTNVVSGIAVLNEPMTAYVKELNLPDHHGDPHPPPPPLPPPPPPLTCASVCRRPMNGIDLINGEGCYKSWEGSCYPLPYNGCDGGMERCSPLAHDGAFQPGGLCYDLKKPSKCAKRASKGKCTKRRVGIKCRKTCGLCDGTPPPSPSPPPPA